MTTIKLPKEYYLLEPVDYNQATIEAQLNILLTVFGIQDIQSDTNYLARCFNTCDERAIAQDIFQYILDTEKSYNVYEDTDKFLKQFIRLLWEAGFFL